MKHKRLGLEFQWHHIYYILALFDILTVNGSLYLNHRIMGIYVDSVNLNHTWATRHMNLGNLSILAGTVNAPGNDVFDSGDVEKETIRRNQELLKFDRKMSSIRFDLSEHVKSEQRTPLLTHLDAVQIAMDRMVEEANLIFSYFTRQESQKAGKRMATMDRKYADVRSELSRLSTTIAKFQEEQFKAQIKAAGKLRQFEYLIGGFIVLMVILVTLYGHRIATVMKKANKEKLEHLRLVEEKQILLCESEERSRGVLEAVSDGIIILDRTGQIQQANPAVKAQFGYNPDELIGQPIDLLICSQEPIVPLAEQSGQKYKTRNIQENTSIEVLGERKDGANFPLEFSLNAMGRSEKQMFTGVMRDITLRKQNESKIKKLALTDSLTGLSNRIQFHTDLKIAIKLAEQSGKKIAVLFIDLDKFKQINDMYGHPAGDKLLCGVAHQLCKTVREKDTVARLGGDEFAIILLDLDSDEYLQSIANRLVQNVSQPISIGYKEIMVKTSIGISVFPDHDINADELIRKADLALYQAKDAGRGVYKHYDDTMHVLMLQREQLEEELNQAIKRNEFVLYYQPQMDLVTNKLIGVEALIRWEHPQRGLLQPGAFLDVADSSKIILEIDHWVLKAVCKQLNEWHEDSQFGSITVSANISARQFQEPTFVNLIESLLKKNKIDPKRLELELTESAMMDQMESVVKIISRLQKLGLGIAIDDFGTGYSSLIYLRQFPVHRLKIDRSFITDLLTNQDDATISRAVIDLGHNLNLRVIAEGVETEDQLCFLKDYGCDEVQGFLIGKPMAADVFASWHRKTVHNSKIESSILSETVEVG